MRLSEWVAEGSKMPGPQQTVRRAIGTCFQAAVGEEDPVVYAVETWGEEGTITAFVAASLIVHGVSVVFRPPT